MKIHIVSDLHSEKQAYTPEPINADYVVYAGDIIGGPIAWAQIDLKKMAEKYKCPVIYVAGNHEHYRKNLSSSLNSLRAIDIPNVHFLENDTIAFPGIRFIGATWWTNFGRDDDPLRSFVMNAAIPILKPGANNQHAIADFIDIRYQDGTLFPEDVVKFHRESSQYIKDQLAIPFDGKTVVVTHFPPSNKSIHNRFKGALINRYFCNDEDDIVIGADLWAHGHVHNSFDYMIDKTRIVCNPRGYYRMDENCFENREFKKKLLIEI